MNSLPEFDDDDPTGQIAAAMSRPISNPEIELRKAEVRDIMLAKRVRSMERVGNRIVGAVIAGSLAVVTAVVSAAYTFGAEQARDREQLNEVIRRLDRLDGHAGAEIERSER